MMRVFVFIVLVFALAAGFAWLADRPGSLSLVWQGYRIETSVMVAALALGVAVAALAAIGAVMRGILAAPRALGHLIGARRRDRGYRALSRGIIAVGAGDVRTARRAAGESSALLSGEPLTLLLAAQAAQLSGDAAGARKAFEDLAGRPDTRILGLHGLFVEASRQGERDAARHFAEEAVRTAPKTEWAGAALFDYQCAAGDWAGALRTLGINFDAGLLDKTIFRRRRAVLLTALALEAEGNDPETALLHAREANRLAPDLAEAAIVAARLLARTGDVRRASRILEAAWKQGPHPEVADSYAALRSGEPVRDRLKRMRGLAETRADHPESAIAVARAAIDGRDWQAARDALAPLARSEPSERVCLLMAEIAAGENGDEGHVRQWLSRALRAPRDPAWVADGRVFDRWAPVSPVSGRIDAFEWKVAAEPRTRDRLRSIEAVEPRSPPLDLLSVRSGLAPAGIHEAGPLRPGEALGAPGLNAAIAPEDTVPRSAPAAAPDPPVPVVPDDPGPAPPEPEDGKPIYRFFRPST